MLSSSANDADVGGEGKGKCGEAGAASAAPLGGDGARSTTTKVIHSHKQYLSILDIDKERKRENATYINTIYRLD